MGTVYAATREDDPDADVVSGEQHHFLVMEYVAGRTLRELLGELGTVPEALVRAVEQSAVREFNGWLEAAARLATMRPEALPQALARFEEQAGVSPPSNN